jgi:hypothetical protein
MPPAGGGGGAHAAARPWWRRTAIACPLGTLSAAVFLVLLYFSGRDSARCYPAPAGSPPGKRCAMHGYGWQLPGSRTLCASVWSSETRWGNELSRYWQGRAMARLGGLGFAAVGDFTHAWLRYLPLTVAAGPPPDSCAAFDAACDRCYDWKYSHKCLGGWSSLSEEVIVDTRAALIAYAKAHKRRVWRADDAEKALFPRARGSERACVAFAQRAAAVRGAGRGDSEPVQQGRVVLARRVRARRLLAVQNAAAGHCGCVCTPRRSAALLLTSSPACSRA